MATRALSITVSAIDNDAPKPAWRRVGSLVVSPKALLAGFVYHPGYDGPPLDPVHLDYRESGQRSFTFRIADGLPMPFHYALPGPNQLLGMAKHHPEISRMPDSELLHHLGPSEAQGLRFEPKTVVIGEGTSYVLSNQPERGFHARMTAFKDVNASDLQTRARSQFKLGHHAYNGITHTIAQDPVGREWLVHMQPKKNPANGPRISGAIFAVLQQAGFSVPSHQVMTLENGDTVLLVERQDVRDGLPMHTLPVSDLLPNPAAATYHQIVDLLHRSSVAPDADIERLAEHVVADIVFNNTGNHSRFMHLAAHGQGYRLGSMYARMAQPQAAAFATSTGNPDHANLAAPENIERLSLSTGIPGGMLARKADALTAAMQNLGAIAQQYRLDANDWGILRAAVAIHQPSLAIHQPSLATALPETITQHRPAAATTLPRP